jgi:hypothetical protein
MNAMLAVGNSPFSDAGAGPVGPGFIAGFVFVGTLLLCAAYRLIRKRRDPHHHRYTLPRH